MPDLSDISDATRQLVRDAAYRERLTTSLVTSDPSSESATRARDAIDAAVVEILTAVELTRGPIRGPVIEHAGRTWFGRKAPDCTLSIDVGAIALLPAEDRPDSLLRTWIHESLHARQPYSPRFHTEWREARGYEEGMVEGLTRLVVIGWLGLRPVAATFDFYVMAYRSLAAVLGIDAERLWRALWSFPAGDVGAMVPSVVERILREQGRSPLSRTARSRLAMLGIRHFAAARVTDHPDENSLDRAWRSVIE